MSKIDFSNYLSPFSWRYGSQEMRKLFSEEHKFRTWRALWVALARAQHKAELVTKEELADLEEHQENLDIDRISEIEKDTHHDVVAAIREYAEHAKVGGGKIHAGATSMDIVDNADIIRFKQALGIIKEKVVALLGTYADKVTKYADLACMSYTHLQPAEPTTLGYRLAFYAQDLLTDLELLEFVQATIAAKGFKGAVGTGASYKKLLEDTNVSLEDFEKTVLKDFKVDASLITTQVYPRKFDYLVLTVLASVSSSCAKFAGDLRILQSLPFGELSEPFGSRQVGSSAMPFKKNPIKAENICSLARYVGALPQVVLENASLSYLERTLDDSANKRIVMAEAFLAVDAILDTNQKIIKELVVNEKRIAQNLATYAPYAATEVILMETVKRGADRQKMHEILRDISMKAWSQQQEGKPDAMETLLISSKDINEYLSENEIKKLLNVSSHIGDAPERALKLVKRIKETVTS